MPVLVTVLMCRSRLIVAIATTVLVACGRGQSERAVQTREPAVDPVQETVTWRAKHESDYRRDWSTIAGLHFLQPGAQTAGSAADTDVALPASVPPVIGRFVLTGETVRFEPAAGVTTVMLRDQPVAAPVIL